MVSTASYDEEFEESLRSFQERLDSIANGGVSRDSPDLPDDEAKRNASIRLVPNVSEEWLRGVKRLWRNSRGILDQDSNLSDAGGNGPEAKRIKFQRTPGRAVTPD